MQSNQSDLYNPDLAFGEDTDQNREKAIMDFKMAQQAQEAMAKGNTLKVLTPEETFIGRITSIIERDENHLVNFDQCRSADGSQYLSQRQYFVFDIIQMEDFVEQPYPDSDFDILPDQTQFENEMNNNPESSQPNNPPQESQPMSDSQDSTSNPIPDIYPTPEQDYDLPVQADGTIDLDLLKLTWRTYNPPTPTFHHWCMNRRIPNQMIRNKQRFSDNLKYLEIKSRSPSTALQHYNLWAGTFHRHQKSFEQWFEDEQCPSPLPCLDSIIINTNMDIIAYHLNAMNYIDTMEVSWKQANA